MDARREGATEHKSPEELILRLCTMPLIFDPLRPADVHQCRCYEIARSRENRRLPKGTRAPQF